MRRPLLLGACLIALGCREKPPLDTERTLTVFAAASLAPAFEELARELERRTPQLSVRINAAGSQQLVRQLSQGAEADVFAAADERWMRFVAERGLVESPRLLARNRLVVIVANRPELQRLELLNLASPGVKVVLAAPEVPAGGYAREVLRRLGAAPGFGADFAGRVEQGIVSLEDNVRGVLTKVRLGEADAGIVYASDVVGADSGLRLIPIPPAFNVTADYYIAIVRSAGDSASARAFVALALGNEGQAILSRRGFIRADRTPP